MNGQKNTRGNSALRQALAVAALCSMMLVACGCAAYHFGTSLPKEQRVIAVETVENLTTEPVLATLTRDALAESFSRLPGVKIASFDGEDAGLHVKVKLISLSQDNLARAQIREEDDRRDDGDAYQTVLYRLTLRAEWQATPTQGEGVTPPRTGAAVGNADMPLMADKETALRTALRQAAMDLARNIAAEVAD